MTDDFTFLDPGELVDFEMRSVPDGTPMGNLRFRVGDADTVLRYPCHIGYDVNPEFRGRRYAARSLGLILALARAHGLTRLWIGCRPENPASRRTCELAGAKLHEIVDIPQSHEMYQQGIHSTCRYYIDLGAQ